MLRDLDLSQTRLKSASPAISMRVGAGCVIDQVHEGVAQQVGETTPTAEHSLEYVIEKVLRAPRHALGGEFDSGREACSVCDGHLERGGKETRPDETLCDGGLGGVETVEIGM